MKKRILIIALLLLIIDQLIKYFIANNMILFESITVIKNFFSITYVQNYGAAFSILNGNRMFLIIVTLLSIILIYHFFIKKEELNQLKIYTYGILLAGILGNLIDRLIHGYVIDFMDFNFGEYRFPVFNFADMCIVISSFMIIMMIIKGDKEHEKIQN